MTTKVSVFIATSPDGYIARADGGLDWLDAANATLPAGEDCGFRSFMQSVDALVMGRNSFEKVVTFGHWPYGNTPVTVLSSSEIAFPDNVPASVRHSSESPTELCQRLHLEGVRHIYVDGGNTIQRFLSAGLVNEITLTVIPIILGDGIRLFGSTNDDIPLKCTGAQAYDSGFVQLKYAVVD